MYDIGKRSSFDNCEKWIQDVKEEADPDITIMLVGNKLDKADTNGREVTEEEGRAFAESHKLMFKETSAMADKNVKSGFEELMEKIDENRVKTNKDQKVGGASGVNLRAGSTHFGKLDEES